MNFILLQFLILHIGQFFVESFSTGKFYETDVRPADAANSIKMASSSIRCAMLCSSENNFKCWLFVFTKVDKKCEMYFKRQSFSVPFQSTTQKVMTTDKTIEFKEFLVYCPTGYVYLPTINECFKYLTGPHTYADALAMCVAEGAHLPVIPDDRNNVQLTDFTRIVPYNWIWLGAVYIAATSSRLWKFCNRPGTTMSYNKWTSDPGVNTNGYLITYMSSSRSTWVATGSTDTNAVTCQYEPIPFLQARCPVGYTYMVNVNTCFKSANLNGAYSVATSTCSGTKTPLPMIYNANLNQALVDFSSCLPYSWIWLGAELSSGSTFVWKPYCYSNHPTATYYNFAATHPVGNPYVYMKTFQQASEVGMWVNTGATDSNYIVCQYDP